MGFAHWSRWVGRRIWLVLEQKMGPRADVCLLDGRIRLDRAETGSALAHHTGKPSPVRSDSGLLTAQCAHPSHTLKEIEEAFHFFEAARSMACTVRVGTGGRPSTSSGQGGRGGGGEWFLHKSRMHLRGEPFDGTGRLWIRRAITSGSSLDRD